MELNKVGIAGEFRCVVTSSEGVVRLDTGFQKNLILNQGLDFYGGIANSGDIRIDEVCVIGSGNSEPNINQTKLDSYIAKAPVIGESMNFRYVNDGSGSYKPCIQKEYVFNILNDTTVREIGVSSSNMYTNDYYLNTRALIKDSLGNTSEIEVKTGEVLTTYYRIYRVIDITDKHYVLDITDNEEGVTPYNIVIRPIGVGEVYDISRKMKSSSNTNISSKELVAFTDKSDGQTFDIKAVLGNYVAGTFKNTLTITIPKNLANMSIRKVDTLILYWGFFFLPFQMRLGKVSDDTPLIKTDKDSIEISLEITWGRYEGDV